MKLLANLDLTKNELQNAKIQNLSSSPSTPTAGQIYWDTTQTMFGVYTGSAWIYFASTEYVTSVLTGLKWKDAVRVATTGNITLSGTQTIDGVALSVDDRVLVKDQTTASENGLYLCKSSTWSRTTDADTGTELVSAVIPVTAGTTNADTTWRCTNDTITISSTSIVFDSFGTSIADATTTTKGKVELATQAETEAKTDTTRAVTPSGLVNFTMKYSTTIGDGSSTSITITHSLGTRLINWQITRVASPYDVIYCDIENTSTTQTTFKFGSAPSSNEYNVIGVY